MVKLSVAQQKTQSAAGMEGASPLAEDAALVREMRQSATSNTPTASYHAMNVVVVDDGERHSTASDSARKLGEQPQFGCEFDPSLKSARLLVRCVSNAGWC